MISNGISKIVCMFILSLCFGQIHLNSVLPNGCSFETYIESGVKDAIVCRQLNDLIFDISSSDKENTDYKNLKHVKHFHFQLKIPSLIDSSFNYTSFSKLILGNETGLTIIVFNNIKGFDINQMVSIFDEFFNKSEYKRIEYDFKFVHISLDFYSGNRLIKNCEDYLEEHKNGRYSFFQAVKYIRIKFNFAKYKTPICSLAFNDSFIQSFRMENLINTFMKTKLPRFVDPKQNNLLIESKIQTVWFKVEKIDLDRNLLNTNVFKLVKNLYIIGELNSIQNDLFEQGNLDKIEIETKVFKILSHKQGIEWIKNINKNVCVDFNGNNNLSTIRLTFLSLISYIYYFDVNNRGYEEEIIFQESFPDEDFCLYAQYPFRQLVITILTYHELMKIKNSRNHVTCTLLWLIQYNERIYRYFSKTTISDKNLLKDLDFMNYYFEIRKLTDLIPECEFKKRLNICDKENFNVKKLNSLNNSEYFYLWEFISIILMPLICIFGIVTNILVIVNIAKKENKTVLKENQYDYMKLKALANCGIFFVQIVGLMNICQGPNGLFCSDISRLVPIQYFKIILVEFFGNYFRFVSNLFYIAFLMNRLSLIGKDHAKFTKFMAETKVLHFSIFTLILGFAINFVKVFRYKANFYQYDLDYPTTFSFYTQQTNHILIFVFLVINCICDLINGTAFLIFSLVIDICLVVRLKRTIEEKEAKFKSMKSGNGKDEDGKKKDNKDAVFRAVLLVILNSVINFTCKLPSTLVSINELIISINAIIFNERTGIEYFLRSDIFVAEMKCLNSNLCQSLEKFAIGLFLLSLALDLFFYYNFDRKFNESFSNTFFKNNNNKNNNTAKRTNTLAK